MGTLRFFEEVVSFKIRRTFGFADYIYQKIAGAKTPAKIRYIDSEKRYYSLTQRTCKPLAR